MVEDITIELSNGTETTAFKGNENETILSSGLRQGIALRYHCASGICSTCQATLVMGSAKTVDGDTVLSIHADEGGGATEVLLCKLKPLTDCKVSVQYPVNQTSVEPIRPEYYSGVVRTVEYLGGNLYDLSVSLSEKFCFNPGQYSLIAIGGGEVSRAYSMASYRPDTLAHRYVIAIKEDGYLSKALCTYEAIGQTLSIFGPLGHCYPKVDEFEDIVMIVGGSGVSVALAMLDWYQSNKLNKHGVTLKIYWGVRELYESEMLRGLDATAFSSDGAKISICYDTQPEPFDQTELKYLNFFAGNPADIASHNEASTINEDTGVFISGSSPFVEYVTRSLMLNTAVNISNIRSDSF